jgi:hydroxylaminobenzene mutase
VAVSTLAKIGFVELAVGAVSGWVIVISRERPRWLERIGVRAPRRLLQAHLDLILMGLILIAVGLALPDLPVVLQAILVFGTWINPLAFVPLAFKPDTDQVIAFRAVVAVSFLCVSGGLVAVAVEAIKT